MIIPNLATIGKIFELVADFIAFEAKLPRYIPIAKITTQRIILVEKAIISLIIVEILPSPRVSEASVTANNKIKAKTKFQITKDGLVLDSTF